MVDCSAYYFEQHQYLIRKIMRCSYLEFYRKRSVKRNRRQSEWKYMMSDSDGWRHNSGRDQDYGSMRWIDYIQYRLLQSFRMKPQPFMSYSYMNYQ